MCNWRERVEYSEVCEVCTRVATHLITSARDAAGASPRLSASQLFSSAGAFLERMPLKETPPKSDFDFLGFCAEVRLKRVAE